MHNDQWTRFQSKTIANAAPVGNGRNALWRGVIPRLKIDSAVAGAASS
jgi:hypothetical protein